MKFRFKLQRALDFAEMREQKKQNQLNASYQREKVLHHYLEDTRERVRHSLQQLGTQAGSPMSGILARAAETYNEDARRLEQTIREEKEAQHRLRQELLKLVMRRKALETLKEKKHQDFKAESRAKEQKVLDEVSSINWQRVKHGSKA